MRRSLGYVVKLPDGTRSPKTPKPVSYAAASFAFSLLDGWVTPVFAVRKPMVVPTQITTEAEARAFNALEPKAVVEAWNAKHPIGTRVRYWPLRPTSSVLPIETRTRTAAYLMSKGVDHASIMVEGVTGSVNLSTHVDAIAEPKPAPVVAGERYAVLTEDSGPRAGFQGWGPVSDEDFIGTREQAMRVALVYGTSVVRILPDGAYEAAVEAARREERERVLQELRGTLVQCCVDFAEDEAHAGGLAHAVRCLEDLIAAKKGQAK